MSGIEPGEDAEQGRLAASRAADDGDELAVCTWRSTSPIASTTPERVSKRLRDPLDVDQRVGYRAALRTVTATGEQMSAAFSGTESLNPLRITLAVALNFVTSM